MSERFTPLEVFFSFKSEVMKDEDRTNTVNDIHAQLKMIFEKLGTLDNGRRNLVENQKNILDDVRLKANKISVDHLSESLE